MLILIGVAIDGAATLALGFLIGKEWKESLPFWVSLAVVHGIIAGTIAVLVLAVRALENAAEPPEALESGPTGRTLRGPGIFGQPSLGKAA